MSRKKVICIDAGHGGNDPGAVANGMREADNVYKTAILVAALLVQAGLYVILSRPYSSVNPGINGRWQFANQQQADYFVSIHENAGGGTGAETFYFRENSERSRRSESFAHYVNNRYAERMGLRNRGVKPDTQTFVGALGVLRNTRMPAILVELAFIDSPPHNPDVPILRNQRQRIADELAGAILGYIGIGDEREADKSQDIAPQTLTVDVLGNNKEIGGFIDNGVTFVNLADIARALGYIPAWDRERRKPVISKPEKAVVIHTDTGGFTTTAGAFLEARLEAANKADLLICVEELYLIKTTTHWEARGEDLIGQILITNVIMNRLRDSRFPDNITDVILTPGAFTPTQRPDFRTAQPGQMTIDAVQRALDGADYSQGATFFHAISHLTPDVWHERAVSDGRLIHLFDHGNHRFYKHA